MAESDGTSHKPVRRNIVSVLGSQLLCVVLRPLECSDILRVCDIAGDSFGPCIERDEVGVNASATAMSTVSSKPQHSK